MYKITPNFPGSPREELPRKDVQNAVWRPGRVRELLHVRVPQVPVAVPAARRARGQLRARRRQAPDSSVYGRGWFELLKVCFSSSR